MPRMLQSAKQAQEQQKRREDYVKYLLAHPKKAHDFMIRANVIDKNGKLRRLVQG